MKIRSLLGLREVFNTAAQYTWSKQDPNDTRGIFEIGGIHFNVAITGGQPLQNEQELAAYDGDLAPIVAPGYEWYWDVEFNAVSPDGSNTHDVTGTGNQWAVYSTVIEMVREHMKKFGIGPIYMSAFDSSKQSLYPRLLKRLLPGWRIETVDEFEFIAYPPSV